MQPHRVEVSLAPGAVDHLDEDVLDSIMDSLDESDLVESAVLEVNAAEATLTAIVFLESDTPTRTAVAAVVEACGGELTEILSTRSEVWEEREPGDPSKMPLLRRGHRAVPVIAHMNDAQRMLYTSVSVLNGYGKDATIKHIREYLASQLETVARLIEPDYIEKTLRSLIDMGYIDPELATQEPAEKFDLDTNEPRR